MSKYVKEEDKGFIDKTADEVRELAKGDAFCILPWIHMHPWPQGKVFPCCLSNTTVDDVVGDLNVQTIEEVYNGHQLKRMRRDFLANKKHHSCTKCYDQEALGRIDSLRMKSNEEFVLQPDNWHKFENKIDLVKSTQKTGRVDEVNMAYLDIRFSNICNMRCRMCGPDLSSLWYHDAVDSIYNVTPKQAIYQIAKGSKDFLSQFDQYLHTVEKIYWAGGEPLIQPQHYDALRKLLPYAKNITLEYNSNLNSVAQGDNKIVDLWKHFKRINCRVSIDGDIDIHSYLRTGSDINKIENNIKFLKQSLPDNLFITATCTTSLFNITRFDRIIKYYNKLNLPMHCSLVQYPEAINIKYLPNELKAKVTKDVRNTVIELRDINKNRHNKVVKWSNYVLQYMNNSGVNVDSLTNDTTEYVKVMDKLNETDFLSVYPEFKEYWQ